jgi:hypothetical protein
MKRRIAVGAGWIAMVVVAGIVVAARAPGFAQGTAAAPAPAAKDKAAAPANSAPSAKAADAPVAPPAEKKAAKTPAPKRATNRLPTYYAQVVDNQQRAKIVAIQEDYAGKIEPLQRQIDALVKERDEKAAAVLTPEQRKRVDELRAAAQKARDEKKAAPSEPDEE